MAPEVTSNFLFDTVQTMLVKAGLAFMSLSLSPGCNGDLLNICAI